MSCHESLMARRRKKAKSGKQSAVTTPQGGANGTAPIVLDKSLPALPPNAVPQSALDPEDTEGLSDQVPDLQPLRFKGDSQSDYKSESSSLREDEKKGRTRRN